MKKACILGDYKDIKYHPLSVIEDALLGVFGHYAECEIITDYASLIPGDLDRYSLVVDYISGWDNKGNDNAAAALLSYVAGGGQMLCLHNGVIKHSHHDLEGLYGGSMVMHPPYTRLAYRVHEHPITTGLADFELDEEPYLLDFDFFTQKDVFLTYKYGLCDIPAGWTLSFGSGRVCCVTAGHNAHSFKSGGLRALLSKCTAWLCGMPEVFINENA